jgi:hypothetical protein
MAAKARALIARADAGACTLIIPPIILAETFFTLESYYELRRTDIARMLLEFVGCRGIEALEPTRSTQALEFAAIRRRSSRTRILPQPPLSSAIQSSPLTVISTGLRT